MIQLPSVRACSSSGVVMIVEDHPLVQITAMTQIEDAGMTTVVASDADEALAILASRDDISAMFIDVDMPGSMDGVALARRVRESWPGIGIVVTSGGHLLDKSALPEDVPFLRKPYDYACVVDELKDRVSQDGGQK